jgi:hypothetical protein
MSKLINVTIFHGISLTPLYLGEAIGSNPGYLKLRKIRASQSIARTVSKVYDFQQYTKLLMLFKFVCTDCPGPEQSVLERK